jgi:hypothetical protein
MSAYDEGLACEHEYMIGPPCGEPAAWLLGGVAYCEQHFDVRTLRDSGLRARAHPLPKGTT